MTDKKKLTENVKCNLCGSSSYSVIYEARYDLEKDFDLVDKYRASGDEMLIDRVVKCSKCDLIYISPRPKPELILKGYSEGTDNTFVSQADAREKTFYDSLKIIEKYAPKKGHILDVGTAGGSFLSAAKKRGWQVDGCEPNKWMGEWGNKRYGLKIKQGTLFDQKYNKQYFDTVTLWDVIEHTPDPSKVLAECNRILVSSGILVINYPDIGSWIARILKRKWLFLISVHLYYFNRKTIKKMLAKNGFEIVKVKPHFQKLELSYLIFRAGAYSKFLSKMAGKVVEFLGLGKKQVPYWLGQTFIIARKKHEINK
jgi:2-polyprenyl-3-methyl-5-hydroxy-6-metoxy-1,4-benzoquinol methylase